jgi:hypothetical protein
LPGLLCLLTVRATIGATEMQTNRIHCYLRHNRSTQAPTTLVTLPRKREFCGCQQG